MDYSRKWCKALMGRTLDLLLPPRNNNPCGPYMDVPCGLSARGGGGKEADEDCPSGRS